MTHLSDALEDLAALLDALDLQHPVLVGHSLGGNLSQALVRRHPDRAAGLVVIGATWNAGPLTPAERLALRLAAPMLGLIPAGRLPGLMAKASAVTPAAVAATDIHNRCELPTEEEVDGAERRACNA